MTEVVLEHGLRFCRIPAGTLVMGLNDGDPDERPVHEVSCSEFWMSETTISWFDYARLMGWSPPPAGFPPKSEHGDEEMALFYLSQANKIRLQYCEDKTVRARDWHAHVGEASAAAIFGKPAREDDTAFGYTQKPLVAVSWQEAEELCAKLSSTSVEFRLPTEAEWEWAARSGLVGKRYAWGDEPPTKERCDFERFDEFSIQPSRTYPPNGYGLFAMCGSVWEWTRDEYDALAYSHAPPPAEPITLPEGRSVSDMQIRRMRGRVLRGGSWADGADAVTTSFRMSRESRHWRSAGWGAHLTPNIGFRIVRTPRTNPGRSL